MQLKIPKASKTLKKITKLAQIPNRPGSKTLADRIAQYRLTPAERDVLKKIINATGLKDVLDVLNQLDVNTYSKLQPFIKLALAANGHQIRRRDGTAVGTLPFLTVVSDIEKGLAQQLNLNITSVGHNDPLDWVINRLIVFQAYNDFYPDAQGRQQNPLRTFNNQLINLHLSRAVIGLAAQDIIISHAINPAVNRFSNIAENPASVIGFKRLAEVLNIAIPHMPQLGVADKTPEAVKGLYHSIAYEMYNRIRTDFSFPYRGGLAESYKAVLPKIKESIDYSIAILIEGAESFPIFKPKHDELLKHYAPENSNLAKFLKERKPVIDKQKQSIIDIYGALPSFVGGHQHLKALAMLRSISHNSAMGFLSIINSATSVVALNRAYPPGPNTPLADAMRWDLRLNDHAKAIIKELNAYYLSLENGLNDNQKGSLKSLLKNLNQGILPFIRGFPEIDFKNDQNLKDIIKNIENKVSLLVEPATPPISRAEPALTALRPQLTTYPSPTTSYQPIIDTKSQLPTSDYAFATQFNQLPTITQPIQTTGNFNNNQFSPITNFIRPSILGQLAANFINKPSNFI